MINGKVTINRINLDNLRDGKVRCGWFSDMKYDDGVSVAQVAYWNEYGTYSSPARPFMRPMLHKNNRNILAKLKHEYSMALRNGQNTLNVLSIIGEDVVSKIQAQILATYSPANAPITLSGGWMHNKKSGKLFYVIPKVGTHPLMDTGVMYQTCSYQVEEVFK